MKPGYANVVSFGLALATLSSTRAATTRPPNTPAVWIGRVNPSWARQLLVATDNRLQNMSDGPGN
jgi:hypothetical protein